MAQIQKIIKWLKLQKEGALVGGLFGLMSIYMTLGLATLQSITWWQKILILPTYLTKFIPLSGSVFAWILPIFFGMILGIIADALYKPRQ